MNALERTIDSREVAEMIGKQHKELLRDIRKYIPVLTGANLRSLDYFIASEYIDVKNEVRPCYLLTKIGCDLVANKITGPRGIEFTARYVKRFDEMESKLKKPLSTKELLLQASLDHEERIERLENETEVTSGQRRKIQGKVSSVVIIALGGKKSHAYQDSSIRMTAFRNCYKELQQLFDVASYMDIPRVRFDEAMEIIPRWRPSMELMARIDRANGNGYLFGDAS